MKHEICLYEKYVKYRLDFFLALLALVMLSPILLIIALLVRIRLGSPIIFSQNRIGEREKVFRLYKFRSMTDGRDENGELLPDKERLTAFGNWLRSTSLDELPELVNILLGQMSIIGPRPLLVKYLPRYSAEQHRRHEVRPGLTGYAQVHGRNLVTWEEKFKMDVWYVDHVSFMNDVKIFFETIYTVWKREGINSHSAATMEEFMGST